MHRESHHPSIIESVYCSTPDECREVDVLFVGSGIGLSCVRYLLEQNRRVLGSPLRIAVLDAGPFDLLTHMAHTAFPRRPFLEETERMGGKLTLWGVSAPRPPEVLLHRWPYPYADLIWRFEALEAEMGIHDPIPKSGRYLESCLLDLLRDRFPSCPVHPAPLAINKDGHRWCPLDDVPALTTQGVQLVSRFRCTHLERTDDAVTGVRGTWQNSQICTFHSQVVVLGVGVEQSLPLVRQVCCKPVRLETADHLRIDLHGSLPGHYFGRENPEELGVAVLLMACSSKAHKIPYHLEIKVAPRELWARGYLPSGDNLRGVPDDASIWIQIQAIAAMHDRFPSTDLLNVTGSIPPVMSNRDAAFHGEIVRMMRRVAAAIGLTHPTFALRPLLTNHHTYGAFRVGKAVTPDFQLCGIDNLYILPPTAYVDVDDDANPVLKSRVLGQYAMDAIAHRMGAERP